MKSKYDMSDVLRPIENQRRCYAIAQFGTFARLALYGAILLTYATLAAYTIFGLISY